MIYSTNETLTQNSQNFLDCEILYENKTGIYKPIICGEIILEFTRKNAPSILKFSCINDGNLNIDEGDAVRFKFGEHNMFYGYVFARSEANAYTLDVLCYDQLRYLKNKTTISYNNKKYSELLAIISSSNKLKTGVIEDTGHLIGARIEEGTLFDILGNASDETYSKTGREYVLYDDFGKISLRGISSLFVPIMIDKTAFQSYNYSTSIDNDVYTKITISKDNDFTGQRDLIVKEDKSLQEKWGVLECWEKQNKLSEGEISEIAKNLLSKYSEKKTSLSIVNSIADPRIRAGSSLVIRLNLNDKNIDEIMVVDKVKHKFKSGFHSMDLELSGVRGSFERGQL